MLSTIYGILSVILLGYLIPYVENIIDSYQKGATSGKSASGQIFSLRLAVKELLAHDHRLPHLFIDFKAAYGNLASKTVHDHEIIPRTLTDAPPIATSLLRSFINQDLSQGDAMRQGDALSYILFILFKST